jgi:hypothetical protein
MTITQNNEVYDYIIVGAGPSGLTLAYYLSNHFGKRIIVLDKHEDIGGCHRVNRHRVNRRGIELSRIPINRIAQGVAEQQPSNTNDKNGFSEHGPRVYSSSYTNFIKLLRDMNLDFYSLFRPYDFQISRIGGETASSIFSIKELAHLAYAFVLFILDARGKYGQSMSMKSFTEEHAFSAESIDYIDRVCRLTDGATYATYSLNKFFQLLNFQSIYRLYQPVNPLDEELFSKWAAKISAPIIRGYEVSNVRRVGGVNIVNDEIRGKNIIFAIPPKNLSGLVHLSPEWIHDHTYIPYYCIAFEWDTDILRGVQRVWGFPRSTWGVAYIVLSDYFEEYRGKRTLISTAITIPEGRMNGKTASEASHEELAQGILRVLSENYPILGKTRPSAVRIGSLPNNDSAYIENANVSNSDQFLPFKLAEGIYTVGVQNGKSDYKFTSLEAAVSNAMEFIGIKKARAWTLQSIFWCICFIGFAVAIALSVITILKKK